jgi:hypothetical protein
LLKKIEYMLLILDYKMSGRLHIGTPIWYHFGDGCYCRWSGVVTRLFYNPEEDDAQWAEIVLDGLIVPPKKACCIAVCSSVCKLSVWTTKVSVRSPIDEKADLAPVN